ncbi:polysaccharide pyruvyl transferase family protein [Neobacillus mesonae]|uniref:polysaccharide pyruvyl transferase family protein n=1 Tax=Neobacillus mesonae TaxID=1193713 RepID=UPI00203B665A|nr:polysaccharide pyruvyl transferase family protein [Neobacillus mesonae]MCM3569377.1 polysaccharide pyruvyl transferase family protein [Neobacillus mesonae]
MNILIINAHSSRNKGDAGIILSMVDSLRTNIPFCNIKVKTRFPEVDKEAYDIPVGEAIHNILVDDNTTKLKKLKLAIEMIRILENKKNKPMLRDPDYEWADVVVSCGGGFLLTHGFSVMTLQHLVQIKTAIDYQKPIVIYSQSIGPLYNKIIKNLTKKVLDKVTKIYVREKISYSLLKEMEIQAPVEVVPDSAFYMELRKSNEVDRIINELRISHKGPIIGLTVRDWKFPEVEDHGSHRNKYIKSIQETILFLEKQYEARVLLMPQVLGPNSFNDDRNISREILDGINSNNAQLIDFDFHPRELKYFYSRMDMFIGTRMHSNIFALASNIPTVAINYEHKTKGIMEMLELNDYVVDINDVTPDILVKMSKKCWENRHSLVNHLTKRIPQVIDSSQVPAIFMNQLEFKK